MEHADRFLRRFYIEKGMFGSLSLTFFFYRPPLVIELFGDFQDLSLGGGRWDDVAGMECIEEGG